MKELTIKELTEWIEDVIKNEKNFEIETDREFYFLLGQVTGFIISKASDIGTRLNLKTDILLNTTNIMPLKNNIMSAYNKACYNVDIEENLPFNRAFATTMAYTIYGRAYDFKDIFIAGLFSPNLFNIK